MTPQTVKMIQALLDHASVGVLALLALIGLADPWTLWF